MPTISFDYQDLIDLIGKEVSKEELIEKIPMIGADVERVEGNTFDVEFFPDRPDLFSVEGVARALRAFLDVKPGFREYDVRPSGIEIVVERSVKSVRPFVVCALVKGVRMSNYLIQSLMDMQEKLHLTIGRGRRKSSIGVHDFDKVKQPFIYKAVAPEEIRFVPLARTEEMNLKETLERHEKGIAYAHLLQGFKKYPVIIDENGDVLSFPPIINGSLTAVTENTENLFIEVTGIDFNAISYSLNIITTALGERDGELFSVDVVYDDKTVTTPKLLPRVKKVEIDYANKILGLELSGEEMCNSLKRMGFGTLLRRKEIDVLIPPYRVDIIHPIDLVEDVGIGYNYEKLEEDLPYSMTFGRARGIEIKSEKCREIMVGLGFNEVVTLTLSNESDQYAKMNLEEVERVTIKNPITESHTCLRTSLLPSLLSILRANKHHDLPQKIFEVGDVVLGTRNVRRLAGLSIHSKANFTECKSIVEAILRELRVDYEIRAKEIKSFIGGRCAVIILNEKEIGYFGELHPEVITAFELSYPIIAFEIDI